MASLSSAETLLREPLGRPLWRRAGQILSILLTMEVALRRSALCVTDRCRTLHSCGALTSKRFPRLPANMSRAASTLPQHGPASLADQPALVTRLRGHLFHDVA